MYLNTGRQVQLNVQNGGATQPRILSAAQSVGAVIRYAANFQAALNGANVNTDTSGTLPSLADLRLVIGSNAWASSGNEGFCLIGAVAYFPHRVTLTELQALTG